MRSLDCSPAAHRPKVVSHAQVSRVCAVSHVVCAMSFSLHVKRHAEASRESAAQEVCNEGMNRRV